MSDFKGKTINAEAQLTINAASDGSTDKTPTFAMLAYTGKAIHQYFSQLPIVIDLEGMTIPERSIPIDLQHNRSSGGVGHTTSVKVSNEDGKLQLNAEGVISRATDAARDVVESSKMGFPWQSSMSASIELMEEIKKGKVEVNGRSFNAPILVARKTTLAAIAFVDLGADDDTDASIAARHSRNNTPKGNQMADENGIDAGATPPAQNPPAKTTPTPERKSAHEDIEAMRTSGIAEKTRQSKIIEAAKHVVDRRPEMTEHATDAAERAIEAGIAASDFELEMLRLSRDYPGMGGPRADRAPTNEVLEASLLLSGGMDDEEVAKEYGEQTIDAAKKRYKGGIGLADLVLICAQAGGFSGISVKSDVSAALRACESGAMQINASSTVSLPTILGNIANKRIRSAFNYGDQAWRKVTKIVSHRDFKLNTTATLTGDTILKKLGEDGEIEHGKPGEETYTNQLSTFARMIMLSRPAIVNDDLGALMELLHKLGLGGIRALNVDFWTEWEENAGNFYHANNNNLLTGAGSPLGIDSLTNAIILLMNQTDPDGNKLGITGPFNLVVPPALKNTAHQIINSTEIRDTTSDTKFGTSNPNQGAADIVVAPHLTSSTAWWLTVKPEFLPVIETAFLNGNQRPVVDTEDAEFNKLGMQMRAVYDFGNSKQEYRGGVKSNGA